MVNAPIRLLIAVATYLVTVTVVAVVTFFLVILLAGPHGGLLPRALEGVVLIVGWSLVLVLPFLAAWAMWRRLGKTVPSNTTIDAR
jgi:hypothetical protein